MPPAARPEPPVVLTDAAAVRALAHPARLAVIDALYAGEVLTATQCAALAGTTPSAMSYHLRALERFGVVRRADATSDARQRPWQRAGSALRIDLSSESHGQGAAAATELLIETTMAEDRRRLLGQVTGEAVDDDDRRWREATTYTREQVLVTPDEARAIATDVEAIYQRYAVGTRPDPPAGAERMLLSLMLVRDLPGT